MPMNFDVLKWIETGEEKDRFRNETYYYIVDTVFAHDEEKWETGISSQYISDGDFIIVEQYESREKAQEGHEKWVKLMEENPKRELEDIDLWGLHK